jgi:hypothetical protein
VSIYWPAFFGVYMLGVFTPIVLLLAYLIATDDTPDGEA